MVGTFVGATAAGTANVDSLAGSWPAGVASGDIALFPWSFVNTGTPTDPSGLSLLVDQTGGSDRLRCLYKYCAGTESGTITAATTGTFNRQTWVLAVFRGYQFISGFKVRAETTSGTSHAHNALTTSDGFGGNVPAAGDTIVIIGSARDGTTTTAMTPPAGYNTRTNTEIGIVGSGGTSTALADDGLTNSVTLPTTPAAWTAYSAATASAVTLVISLRPVVTGTTATLAAIMAGMGTANNASAILAATATATMAAMSASLTSNVLATGILGPTLSAITASAAETSSSQSTLAGVMGNMVASNAEASKATSVLAPTLGNMAMVAAEASKSTAVLAGSLSSLIASAVAAGLITSSLASTMPGISASSSGSLKAISSTAIALPAMSAGLTEQSVDAGILNSSLPQFSTATNGSALAIGGLAGALPSMNLTAAGEGRSSATLAETASAAVTALSGASSDTAGLTQTLPGMTAGGTGQATSQADVQASPLPAAANLTGFVEVPATPTGALDINMASIGMSATEHSLSPAGLVATPSTPISAISSESVAEAGVGSILPSPSVTAVGESTLGVQAAIVMPSATAAMDGSSAEESVGAQVDLTLPNLQGDLGGEAGVEGSLMVGLTPMTVSMAQTPPQLTLYCYIEEDPFFVGVEEDSWNILVESGSLDPDMTDNLYTYVEGDRLEAVVE